MAGRVCIAQIGGAHGIRGEVKLKSFTAASMAVKDYGPLESEDGTASFEIETMRPAKGHFVARLRGIADRAAAERLAGIRLFVPRSRLPPPAPGEFYHADLIGLAAVTPEGSAAGTVVAIHNFGAGDILELRAASDDASVMVPFTETFVPSVDLAGGRVVVVPPAEPTLK